jgi:hypothetical protein
MLIHELPLEKSLYTSVGEQIGIIRKLMFTFKVTDLPLIVEGSIKAYIRFTDIEHLKEDDSLDSAALYDSNGFFVNLQDHSLSCLRLFIKRKLSCCAVLDEGGQYVGTIIDRELFEGIGKKYQFGERGSIVVLEFNKDQFLISDVLRIVESEGGFPIMVFTNSTKNQEEIQVTIKLQILDSQSVISSLRRHGIKILYTMEVPDYSEFLNDRYDQLIKYLDI